MMYDSIYYAAHLPAIPLHTVTTLFCFSAVGSYRDGDLRLVGGPHNWEGRVEVFWNGTWGAISDSQWSTTDANVVCKQLKHSPESGNSLTG